MGVLLFLIGQIPANAAVSHTTAVPRPAGLIEEPEWGYWHKSQLGQPFPTVQHLYEIGQTITVPHNVSISVDNVERNWTPQPWQAVSNSVGYQDDAIGKEILLVRFTITNLSNTPIGYSDSSFSLVRANRHEQHVAALAELPGTQYGSFGQTSPWLQPGATMHTFVPFLVNPGEQPQRFVLSWRTIDPTRFTTVTAKNGKKINMPVYINVARIPISLVAPSSKATSVSAVTFAPDMTFTVANADVYSTGN